MHRDRRPLPAHRRRRQPRAGRAASRSRARCCSRSTSCTSARTRTGSARSQFTALQIGAVALLSVAPAAAAGRRHAQRARGVRGGVHRHRVLGGRAAAAAVGAAADPGDACRADPAGRAGVRRDRRLRRRRTPRRGRLVGGAAILVGIVVSEFWPRRVRCHADAVPDGDKVLHVAGGDVSGRRRRWGSSSGRGGPTSARAHRDAARGERSAAGCRGSRRPARSSLLARHAATSPGTPSCGTVWCPCSTTDPEESGGHRRAAARRRRRHSPPSTEPRRALRRRPAPRRRRLPGVVGRRPTPIAERPVMRVLDLVLHDLDFDAQEGHDLFVPGLRRPRAPVADDA